MATVEVDYVIIWSTLQTFLIIISTKFKCGTQAGNITYIILYNVDYVPYHTIVWFEWLLSATRYRRRAYFAKSGCHPSSSEISAAWSTEDCVERSRHSEVFCVCENMNTFGTHWVKVQRFKGHCHCDRPWDTIFIHSFYSYLHKYLLPVFHWDWQRLWTSTSYAPDKTISIYLQLSIGGFGHRLPSFSAFYRYACASLIKNDNQNEVVKF